MCQLGFGGKETETLGRLELVQRYRRVIEASGPDGASVSGEAPNPAAFIHELALLNLVRLDTQTNKQTTPHSPRHSAHTFRVEYLDKGGSWLPGRRLG